MGQILLAGLNTQKAIKMYKKYVLVSKDTRTIETQTLYRIKALRAFGNVKEGELGGYISSESNLSHEGLCWVYDNARVCGNAQVYDDAQVSGDAWVSGNAHIENNQTIMWFSKVGSENGTLTAFQGQHKNILVTRGCFFGTLEYFEKAVKEKHGSSKYGKEYTLLIEVIKLRFS